MAIGEKLGVTSQVHMEVTEEMRPRAMRALGIPLAWDQAIDQLAKPTSLTPSSLFALACVAYRKIRPTKIGNRCCFEPSCSRFSEVSFRMFGFRRGLALTYSRLSRCKAGNGGVDLPPTIFSIKDLQERILK